MRKASSPCGSAVPRNNQGTSHPRHQFATQQRRHQAEGYAHFRVIQGGHVPRRPGTTDADLTTYP